MNSAAKKIVPAFKEVYVINTVAVIQKNVSRDGKVVNVKEIARKSLVLAMGAIWNVILMYKIKTIF